jgi:hypothetical protein
MSLPTSTLWDSHLSLNNQAPCNLFLSPRRSSMPWRWRQRWSKSRRPSRWTRPTKPWPTLLWRRRKRRCSRGRKWHVRRWTSRSTRRRELRRRKRHVRRREWQVPWKRWRTASAAGKRRHWRRHSASSWARWARRSRRTRWEEWREGMGWSAERTAGHGPGSHGVLEHGILCLHALGGIVGGYAVNNGLGFFLADLCLLLLSMESRV